MIFQPDAKEHIFVVGDEKYSLTTEECWQIFSGRNLLNEDGSPKFTKEVFKALSKITKNMISEHIKKGEYLHISKVSDSSWEKMTKDMPKKVRQKGVTYTKKK